MPKLSRELWEALYARAIVTSGEARGRILADGLPEPGLDGLMAELERAKVRYVAAGRVGPFPMPGAEVWMPDPVWLLAIAGTTADQVAVALARDGWAARDASDLVALGLRIGEELAEDRRRRLAVAAGRR